MNAIKDVPDPRFLAGLIVVRGIKLAPSSSELKEEIREIIQNRLENPRPESCKTAIRDLLRRGGFSPSGRNKPCNEYLVNAAREGRFPEINNVVDVVNALSLDTGLPLCVQDLSATGLNLIFRYGKPGEKNVFNAAGQEIDLNGLICLCRNEPEGSTPLSNPVKDSMLGKIKPESTDILGIVYSTRDCTSLEQIRTLLDRFQALWLSHAGGTAGELLILE